MLLSTAQRKCWIWTTFDCGWFIEHVTKLHNTIKLHSLPGRPRKNWFLSIYKFAGSDNSAKKVYFHCTIPFPVMNIYMFILWLSTKVLGHFRYLGTVLRFEWDWVCSKNTFFFSHKEKKRKFLFNNNLLQRRKKREKTPRNFSRKNILLLSWKYDDVYYMPLGCTMKIGFFSVSPFLHVLWKEAIIDNYRKIQILDEYRRILWHFCCNEDKTQICHKFMDFSSICSV